MKWRILVVEDAHALRKDIIEMLRFEGFDVLGAENGRVGVEMARKHQPDLIVCDIMMPELDGYGVLEELQKNTLEATIPFVFLTAKTDKSDIRAGMRMGANDYLTKPFTAQELIGTVYTQINKRMRYRMLSEQKLNQLRENIILALPHELRTPLTGILGFSDLLAMDAADMPPEQTSEMAHYIRSAAQRLYRLTENYVIYAQTEVMLQDAIRVQAMRQFMTMQPEVIVEVQAMQRAAIYRREASLKLEIEPVAEAAVLDEHLRKIVDELVDNAFKFSDPSTTVWVSAKPSGSYLVIQVTDSGRGMAPENVWDIGAYSQFDRDRFEQQGSGFGLAIVKRMVELHGGLLEIEVLSGPKTRVTVKLPLRPVPVPAAQVAATA